MNSTRWPISGLTTVQIIVAVALFLLAVYRLWLEAQ
jgi:hypothetical protein